ncbi:MAG TPA: GreA/GreB family elongation factor [Allosphingosinicella sp.]|nr:GreA/GreB family elongation factor [Allosphingosinicella sp.]
MSRAFVKEDDDAPPPPPLGRTVSSAPNRVTARGLRLIDEEIARIEAALGAGQDAEVEARLRRDLRYWGLRRATAQPVTPDPAPRAAGFGAKVTIRRGSAIQVVEIVGEDEADPAQGRIGWTSPLARALDGAAPGETVELGAEPVEVLAVAPGEGG